MPCTGNIYEGTKKRRIHHFIKDNYFHCIRCCLCGKRKGKKVELSNI